jgi:hypothetical protein
MGAAMGAGMSLRDRMLRHQLDAALKAWTSSQEHSTDGRQGAPCVAAIEMSGPCCIDDSHEQYEKMLDFLVRHIQSDQ